MHSQEYNGVTFNYNGGFDGDVEITCNGGLVIVPFEALKAFVADYVRQELIAYAESAADDDLLKIAVQESNHRRTNEPQRSTFRLDR